MGIGDDRQAAASFEEVDDVPKPPMNQREPRAEATPATAERERLRDTLQAENKKISELVDLSERLVETPPYVAPEVEDKKTREMDPKQFRALLAQHQRESRAAAVKMMPVPIQPREEVVAPPAPAPARTRKIATTHELMAQVDEAFADFGEAPAEPAKTAEPPAEPAAQVAPAIEAEAKQPEEQAPVDEALADAGQLGSDTAVQLGSDTAVQVDSTNESESAPVEASAHEQPEEALLASSGEPEPEPEPDAAAEVDSSSGDTSEQEEQAEAVAAHRRSMRFASRLAPITKPPELVTPSPVVVAVQAMPPAVQAMPQAPARIAAATIWGSATTLVVLVLLGIAIVIATHYLS